MIVTFFGHADFRESEKHRKKVLNFLEEKIGEKTADIYLGGYGNFDNFAYNCCYQYKKSHPNTSLFFITPYITFEYQKSRLNIEKYRYDGIIYPEIESKPLKFAISYRNKWMVLHADIIVAYVNRHRGGAYSALTYAKRLKKEIFNLATT